MTPVFIVAIVAIVALGMLYLSWSRKSAGAGSDHGSGGPPAA